jgi:hypothetical protein
MSERENPATVWLAHWLAQKVHGVPWRLLDFDGRGRWLAVATELITDMYGAGFTIPQPGNPGAIWDEIEAQR